MDIVDKKTRSRMMAGIGPKNTKPELVVRKYLHGKGLRFRIHDKKLPGSPDLVLNKYRTVVFVNGCFWHGHEGCKKAKLPSTRKTFWKEKISENKERDRRNIKTLEKSGWKVLTIWECKIGGQNLENLYEFIIKSPLSRINPKAF